MDMKDIKWVKRDTKKTNLFWPSDELKKRAWVNTTSIYREANKNPVKFWEKLAREGIEWFKQWDKAYESNPPFFKWFKGAKVNACYNAVDRHLKEHRNKAAIIWIPEPINESPIVFTYFDLYKKVNKFANALKKLGIKRGDVVAIYMPMIPEVIITMLACARIGAVHSVVFSAFSPGSLRTRLIDGKAKLLVTADGYYRRGKVLNLKNNADIAVRGTWIKKVIVVKRAANKIKWIGRRDLWWDEIIKEAKSYCKPTTMNSEDPLFILYTSGTTGKPKGIIHDTGGYITQAYWTTKWDFNLHNDDLLWCTADIGWITGHTYLCYGPLLNGGSTLVFEGAPDFPTPGRWWEIIENHGVTVLYTAPTAIRMFMKYGDKWPKKHDLSSLRILGSVGEPIDVDTWFWYFTVIGGRRCPIIDTWWQTETGGTLINNLPGTGPFIPTVAGRSFPGTKHTILDENGRELPPNKKGFLVQKPPFAPGMLRGVFGNPMKYKEEYFTKFGVELYLTGDGAFIDNDGNFRLIGRLDDIMKVAGHRLSAAELENAIDKHRQVDECAVVPMPHKIKGHVPVAFVVLKSGKGTKNLENELIMQVDQLIGPTARPGKIFFVNDLPKTRSGKIMRRVLRNLVSGERNLGNLSTLLNPESINELKKIITHK